jgi:hypothetical protein
VDDAGADGASGGDTNNPRPGNGGTKNGSGGSVSAGGSGVTSGGSTASGGSTSTTGGTDSGTGGSTVGTGGTGGTTVVSCSKSLLDDFENANSAWYAWKDTKSTGKLTMKRETPGREGGSALHTVGTGIDAMLGSVQLNPNSVTKSKACPEFSASTGLKFWAKGVDAVRVAAVVAGVLPPANGGTCTNAEACWASHGKNISLSSSWTEYAIPWEEFTQNNPVVETAFDKTQIKQITFTNATKVDFDYWLDDVSIATTGIDNPDDKGTPTCTVAKYMSANDFNSWFPQRAGVYQFDSGLCEAIKRYWTKFTWKFANSGNAETDKREIAAFFAHISWETVYLQHTEEVARTDPPWYGRGPLQLTHQNNYRAAGTAMGADLLTDPGVVATDPVITWGAALWFWMTSQGAGTFTCHDAMVKGEGNFSETSRTINGAVEGCSGGAASQRASRYTQFCGNMSVNPGSGPTTC